LAHVSSSDELPLTRIKVIKFVKLGNMADLTIAIPVATNHEALYQRAVESVKAQTRSCALAIYHDTNSNGAGYARNQLLSMVTTPFVTFLDADDYLDPRFAEIMLPLACAYYKAGLYIYPSWYEHQGGRMVRVTPNETCYCLNQGIDYWHTHVITSVIATKWAREAGGFDEELIGIEDTDFYHKLRRNGHCGYHINVPLLHWAHEGNSRSVKFQRAPEFLSVKDRVKRRYEADMGCCGANMVVNTGPFNEKQANDVLAQAWGSKILLIGCSTGRIYPHVGYGEFVWVDPADIWAEPERLTAAPVEAPAVEQSFVDAVGEVMLSQTQQALRSVPAGASSKPGLGAIVYSDGEAKQPIAANPATKVNTILGKIKFD